MRRTYIRCPYCGYSNAVELVEEYHQRTVVTCDNEDAEGCGRDFVADILVRLDTKALKIEGEEDKEND